MTDAELLVAEINWRAAAWDAERFGRWSGASTTIKVVPQPIYDRLERAGRELFEIRKRKQWEYL